MLSAPPSPRCIPISKEFPAWPPHRRDSLDVVGFLQQREQYTEAYLDSLKPIHQPPRKWFELLAWWWLLAGALGALVCAPCMNAVLSTITCWMPTAGC